MADPNLPYMCMCVCVVIPFILDVRLVDAPAKVTQDEGHRISPPSFCRACLNFYRENDFSRPFPSSTVMSNFVYPRINRPPSAGHDFSQIPVRVTAPRFELTPQRQKVSRLPTEPPGRPAKPDCNCNGCRATTNPRWYLHQ